MTSLLWPVLKPGPVNDCAARMVPVQSNESQRWKGIPALLFLLLHWLSPLSGMVFINSITIDTNWSKVKVFSISPWPARFLQSPTLR